MNTEALPLLRLLGTREPNVQEDAGNDDGDREEGRGEDGAGGEALGLARRCGDNDLVGDG